MTLAQHEARVAHDLSCLNYGAPNWVTPRYSTEGHVYDVVIVGGGQSGLGAAFGLLRERISNILVIDENPAGYEGPWETYARMITLRTPKHLTAIDFGVPSLTFRAYWEAAHGQESWNTIDKIPRERWMDYLRWFRNVLRLPVRNDTRLTLVEPAESNLFRLRVADGGALLARKVILATGIQGGGRWHTPAIIEQKLPRDRYAHTADRIDFAKLRGKRIGILGGGASAFDNAQYALGLGVGEAHVFVRRKTLPTVNPIRFMESSGFIPRFAALPDSSKYKVMASFFHHSQPPTNDTFRRAATWPNFELHLGCPWLDAEETSEGVVITTPRGKHFFHFLILATGLVTDPALRPELALLSDKIERWADRYVPLESERVSAIDSHPYLGPSFELLPRETKHASSLHGLFVFNYSALINFGLSASALSGLSQALPILVRGVADQLFLDDERKMVANFLAYAEPEFVGRWQYDVEPAV